MAERPDLEGMRAYWGTHKYGPLSVEQNAVVALIDYAAGLERAAPRAPERALAEARARINTLEAALCAWHCGDCGYDLALDQDEDEEVGQCGTCATARSALRGEEA